MTTSTESRFWAVIPAAGVGARMQVDKPKQYLKIAGNTILEHTLTCFNQHPMIAGIVLILSDDDAYWPAVSTHLSKPLIIASGGKERCHSVLSGLQTLQDHADPDDWVLVHDAARPCLRQEDIDRLITELRDHPVGGLLALPVRDTLKRSDATNTVSETVNRDLLWHALTPQMFRLGALQLALQNVIQQDLIVTDEAQAMEKMGQAARLIEGHPDNIKITRPLDLQLAEQYLHTIHSK